MEGRAVSSTIGRPGVWKRAGLTGVLVGLDLAEARLTLPACDVGFATRLFLTAEAAWIQAAIALEKTKGDGDG